MINPSLESFTSLKQGPWMSWFCTLAHRIGHKT